ncbi:uncharacterized protein DUF1918 [Mumia flava]|uniref:Uncharacterized protein DUF1918 n=1 Tax=Mumia flava TaxID=1348852 RepID=A0A0B2B8B6_9ACTN|nr:DUF1918 domain-containing protein [Mumia flava]PJJ53471.1 uncharacterized protein DUF1918 [Mumia flava]
MHAQPGEKVTIHGGKVGTPDRHGEVVEVHGEDGGPPFLVRFDDGSETLLFPGPDCTIEHAGG